MVVWRRGLRITALGILLVSVLASQLRAKAEVSGYIQGFYANCNDFSVGVYLAGQIDSGDGFERFRYQVSDGSGSILYEEDAARPVGQGGYSEAFNLAFQTAPTQNPVTFSVLVLGRGGDVVGKVDRVSRNVDCLPSSGLAVGAGGFLPYNSIPVGLLMDTALYDAPNGVIVENSVQSGEILSGMYHTVDDQWVAIYYNRPELLWAPASAIVTPQVLALRPTRIERAPILGQPTGVVLVGDADVYTQPSIDSPILGRLDPSGMKYVAVLARTADDRWWQVDDNGPGWVQQSAVYRTLGGDKLNIPIIATR